MSITASKVINVILYQLGWFSCVLGAARGYPLGGALFALLLILVHLFLAEERKAELLLLLCACLLGVAVDSTQQALGVFSLKIETDWPLWLPPWIFVIWAQFASLFRYALFWLVGRPLLAAGFGLVGGPLAYWGGARLGAAELGDSHFFSLLALAVVWALVAPLLFWLSGRISPREGRYRRLGGVAGKEKR